MLHQFQLQLQLHPPAQKKQLFQFMLVIKQKSFCTFTGPEDGDVSLSVCLSKEISRQKARQFYRMNLLYWQQSLWTLWSLGNVADKETARIVHVWKFSTEYHWIYQNQI